MRVTWYDKTERLRHVRAVALGKDVVSSFAAVPLRAELAPGLPGNLQVNLHTDASLFRLVQHPVGCNRVLDGNAHGFEKGNLLVVLPASGCTIDHLAKFRIRLATGQD